MAIQGTPGPAVLAGARPGSRGPSCPSLSLSQQQSELLPFRFGHGRLAALSASYVHSLLDEDVGKGAYVLGIKGLAADAGDLDLALGAIPGGF
jgi:hypothetical protein